MILFINSFIIYILSFLFSKLYFNIFRVLRSYIVILPKLYSTYTLKKKIYYFNLLILLCIIVFCKVNFFIYYYILLIFNIIMNIYVDFGLKFKKTNIKILYFIFFLNLFNLLIHLKVLNSKFKDKNNYDKVNYALKWNSFYFFYYIIYMFKDIISILYWYVQQIQWHILYLKIIFYFKIKKLECIYYIKLFVRGFLNIYLFSVMLNYINNTVKWKKPNKSKNNNVSFISKIKFKYHRNNRILKEKYYKNVKKPLFLLSYSVNNFIESIFYVLFSTGANSIIYYFYKFIKYLYSIAVYLWKSDVIYRFFKFIERKKW